jgi:hypothetical protein
MLPIRKLYQKIDPNANVALLRCGKGSQRKNGVKVRNYSLWERNGHILQNKTHTDFDFVKKRKS